MQISPCVGICRLDAASTNCTGCRRTLQEIANWTNLNYEEQERITARVLLEAFENPQKEFTMYTIYSKPNCPSCEQAKALLASKGESFTVINLDIGQPKEEGSYYISREELVNKFPTARTVPQIMQSKTYVGGFLELQKLLQQAPRGI